MQLNECINFMLTNVQNAVFLCFKKQLQQFNVTPIQYALLLTDEAGNSLKVNRGKSYVAVVSLAEYDNFSVKGAEGSAADESVSVDPNAAQDEAAAEAAGE